MSGDRPALPLRQLVTLTVYWFGIVTIWNGLGKIVIPLLIKSFPGGEANYGTLIVILTSVGVIAPIIVQPTVGVISDYTMTRWGRRKPYILIGGLLDLVFLYGIATSDTFVTLVAFYFLLQVSSNFAQAPFQGYVPDLVPARQVGLASGLMGLMIVLGSIAGVGIATYGVQAWSVFAGTMALAAVELVAMVIVITTVHEGTKGPKRTMSWTKLALSAWGTDILREKSVLWLLAVRLLFLGAYSATSFALIYFERTHGLTTTEASTMVFIAVAIVGVMTGLASLPGARLSDRFGRKPVLYGGMALTAFGLAGLALAPSPTVAIILFIPAGLGIGSFLSVDWALMTDVIPKHTSARYMGVLNAGTAMAEPVYLVFGGLTLTAAGLLSNNPVTPAGPVAAIWVGVVFLALAVLALTRVDATRREAVEVAELAAA